MAKRATRAAGQEVTTTSDKDRRARPTPSNLPDLTSEAADRLLKRREPVQLRWSGEGGTATVNSAYDDDDGFAARVADTFATRSTDFMFRQMADLDWAAKPRGAARGASAEGLNAALALVGAVRPQNELEAALAVQMAGVHSLTAEMLGRARQSERTDHVQLYAGLAVKLARTFTAQVEALAKLRGEGRQTVEVRHVHVHPGAQAVVGAVTTGGNGGGG